MNDKIFISNFVKKTFYAIIYDDMEIFDIERTDEIYYNKMLEYLFQIEDTYFQDNPNTSLQRVNRKELSEIFLDYKEWQGDDGFSYNRVDVVTKMYMYQLAAIDYQHIDNNKYYETLKIKKNEYSYYMINLNDFFQFIGLFLQDTLYIKTGNFLYHLMTKTQFDIYQLKPLHDYYIIDYYEKRKKECPICFENKMLKEIYPCHHEFCVLCLDTINNNSCPLCRGN